MAYILLGLGMVMIVEGLAYALAPSLIERMLEMLRTLPEESLRLAGMLALVFGLALVWLAFQIGI